MQYVKHKYFKLGLGSVVLLWALALAPLATPVYADGPCTPDNQIGCTEDNCATAAQGTWNKQTSSCDVAVSDPAASENKCADLNNCDLITRYLNPFIQFLSALVGVVVVISIIIGGIQYSSSAGDPQRAQAAKNRIRNAIIALITFIFLYALLNFLVPGGLFNK